MKKLLILACLPLIVLYMSGCVSYANVAAGKKEIMGQRIYASGDQEAIKAFNLGNGGVGIGFDILATDVIKAHPFRTLGAAILDAGMAYGAYRGVEALSYSKEDNNGRELTVTTDGNDNIFNINTGDVASPAGNNSNAGDSNQSPAEAE